MTCISIKQSLGKDDCWVSLRCCATSLYPTYKAIFYEEGRVKEKNFVSGLCGEAALPSAGVLTAGVL